MSLQVCLTGISPRNDMAFLPLRADRWYLRGGKTPPAQTIYSAMLSNSGINELLPFGANNTIWRGLFNEIQMLLHEHPLNQTREARGEPVINGPGSGEEESCRNQWCPLTSRVEQRCSCRVPRGCLQHYSCAAPPKRRRYWRQSAISGNHLIVLDALQGRHSTAMRTDGVKI